MKRPLLSVVIPAYNESQNFRAGVLESVRGFLSKQKFSWEVIFVNDGSTDETKSLLARFCRTNRGYRLLNIPHGGKAAAVSAGMLASKGEIALFTDFDQSTPLKEVLNFIKAHEEGADVVIGVRGVKEETKNDTLFRKLRSKIFVFWVQMILLPEIQDSQCGFKSFRRKFIKPIFTNLKVTKTVKISGAYMGAFDVEALFLAKKLGAKIVQLPVSWTKILSQHLNIWKEPLQMAIDVLKVRCYDIVGRYRSVSL